MFLLDVYRNFSSTPNSQALPFAFFSHNSLQENKKQDLPPYAEDLEFIYLYSTREFGIKKHIILIEVSKKRYFLQESSSLLFSNYLSFLRFH